MESFQIAVDSDEVIVHPDSSRYLYEKLHQAVRILVVHPDTRREALAAALVGPLATVHLDPGEGEGTESSKYSISSEIEALIEELPRVDDESGLGTIAAGISALTDDDVIDACDKILELFVRVLRTVDLSKP